MYRSDPVDVFLKFATAKAIWMPIVFAGLICFVCWISESRNAKLLSFCARKTLKSLARMAITTVVVLAVVIAILVAIHRFFIQPQ